LIRDSLSNFISPSPPDSDPLGNGEFGKSCAGQSSQFVFRKLMLLVSALFAFFCYKRQLASVGDALLETQLKDAGKATTEG
jgi:hypothetical protein